MNNNEEIIEDVIEETAEPKAAGMDTNRKIMLGLIIALMLVAAIMHGWRVASVGAMENKLAVAESKQAEARDQLIEQARQLDARKAEESLRLFSVPIAWVIRRDAMAGNLDQIDQYFTDLVQLRGFQTAVLARPDGKILVASDRKQLADAFASLYPAEYLQASDIRVERTATGNLRAIIPVLGLNQQLGTVVLEYTPPAYTLK
ncbi:MAG: hypothetical protein Q8M09_02610 [Pseudomonadota bacterium]|nr:hypothetical protein [Pseudomonadota bacterium]MDP2353702.1 hypothetical protein [Pseudomonadota bacterium]